MQLFYREIIIYFKTSEDLFKIAFCIEEKRLNSLTLLNIEAESIKVLDFKDVIKVSTSQKSRKKYINYCYCNWILFLLLSTYVLCWLIYNLLI